MNSTISVCIATYHRPHELRKLLQSLISQETNGEFSFTIHVADNDVYRSAEPVVREFNTNGHSITYDVEPEQNISLARNKSLTAAKGNYIATVDDDSFVDSRWLLELYRAALTHHADVVNGPVSIIFPAKTPGYIQQCSVFNRPNPSTGLDQFYIPTTANSLFRRSLISNLQSPFDPLFGKTGGEDTVFFNFLKGQGYRMIWCREAIVYVPIGVERARLRWIFKRVFRFGYNSRRLHRSGRKFGKRKLLRCLKRILTSSLLCAFYAGRAITSRKFSNQAVNKMLMIAFAAGQFAFQAKIPYEAYTGKRNAKRWSGQVSEVAVNGRIGSSSKQ